MDVMSGPAPRRRLKIPFGWGVRDRGVREWLGTASKKQQDDVDCPEIWLSVISTQFIVRTSSDLDSLSSYPSVLFPCLPFPLPSYSSFQCVRFHLLLFCCYAKYHQVLMVMVSENNITVKITVYSAQRDFDVACLVQGISFWNLKPCK